MEIWIRILMGILYGNLMGILMMDSMGCPYDSFYCFLFIQEFGTDCFRLVVMYS